jgi:hypothetical protein
LPEDQVNCDSFIAKMAVFVVMVAFIYLAAVTFLPIPDTGIKYADIIVPSLINLGLGVIIGYFYGTSQGSQRKDTTIKNALEGTKAGESTSSVVKTTVESTVKGDYIPAPDAPVAPKT